jgi:hypothetical protein
MNSQANPVAVISNPIVPALIFLGIPTPGYCGFFAVRT